MLTISYLLSYIVEIENVWEFWRSFWGIGDADYPLFVLQLLLADILLRIKYVCKWNWEFCRSFWGIGDAAYPLFVLQLPTSLPTSSRLHTSLVSHQATQLKSISSSTWISRVCICPVIRKYVQRGGGANRVKRAKMCQLELEMSWKGLKNSGFEHQEKLILLRMYRPAPPPPPLSKNSAR